MAYSETYRRFCELLDAREFGVAEAFAERESLARPDDEAFWLTQVAVARLRAGRGEAAAEAAERAVALAPANRFALIARADAGYAGGRFEDALTDYHEALDEPRLAARARRSVLQCLIRLERWEEILRQLDAWGMPENEAFEARAKALAALGRDAEALALCARWLAAAPDNPRALWLLADLEIRRDGIEAVAARVGRLARIPSRPGVYREIYASLCRRMGREAEAVAAYDRLAEAAEPRVQRKQAFALAKSGREAEAIPIFEQLLRDDPRDMYVHTAYTAACRRANCLPRAQEFYQDLLRQHPEAKGIYGRLRRVAAAMAATPAGEETDDTR